MDFLIWKRDNKGSEYITTIVCFILSKQLWHVKIWAVLQWSTESAFVRYYNHGLRIFKIVKWAAPIPCDLLTGCQYNMTRHYVRIVLQLLWNTATSQGRQLMTIYLKCIVWVNSPIPVSVFYAVKTVQVPPNVQVIVMDFARNTLDTY